MNVFRLNECVDPTLSLQSKMSLVQNPLSDCSPLRPPKFTLKVEGNYTTSPSVTPFITSRIFRLNYAGDLSFGQQLLYPSNFSILYWWEIKQQSRRHKFFKATKICFVVQKRRNTEPPSALWYVDSIIYSTSQCALLAQKYVQAVRFRIPFQMRKKFWWIFRFLPSTAMTPGITQEWRLIFVLERFIFRFGNRIEACITCDKVLRNNWTVFIT
jgi:hypothetical protein